MGEDNTFDGIFNSKPTEQPKNEDTTKEQVPDASNVKTEQQASPESSSSKPLATGEPVRRRGRKKKDASNADGANADKAGHFSCICDKDLIDKVRAIAWQEHMTVRAVVETMFTKCIAKYEKKHGAIQTEPSNTSSEELF